VKDGMRKFIPKVGCMSKKRFVILRDEEVHVGGLEMVTTDENLVLRGD